MAAKAWENDTSDRLATVKHPIGGESDRPKCTAMLLTCDAPTEGPMKLALPFPEAISLATAQKPLPPVIRSVDCLGDTLHAEIALDALPGRSIALQLAAAVAGTVTVTARLAGYAEGVATFVITAHALALPLHKLLPFLLDPVNKAIRDRGLPEGLLRVERGDAAPVVLIDVQKAVETKASGVVVTNLELVDAVLHADATIGTVTLR
jgi:hypothetical protein